MKVWLQQNKELIACTGISLVAIVAAAYMVFGAIHENRKLELENAESHAVMRGQCGQMWWSLKTGDYKPDMVDIYRHVYGEVCKGERPL